MTSDDASRWNSRYQTKSRESFDLPRNMLLEHSDLIPTQGLALDIAMGLGGNASFLLQHGLRVIGVDISYVALRKAKVENPGLMAVVADLENFYISPNQFDLIIDFLYLQRELWIQMADGLKIGGILFIECLTDAMLSIHPEINHNFLLKPDELKQAFLKNTFGINIELLYYSEGWQPTNTSHPRATACLIASRIA